MVSLRLIAASLKTLRGLFALWVVSLALAVTGLVVVDLYRASLAVMIARQGRAMLGGDLSLSARRVLSDAERARFRELVPRAEFSDLTELTAMVSTARATRLVSLRFIDDAYPLVGEVVINDHSRRGAEFSAAPRAWVAPDLLSLMELKLGDHLKIGELDVVVDGVIARESAQAFRFGALAPRVLVHRRFQPRTGLVRFGSTLTDTILARTDAPDDGRRASVERAFTDPALDVADPRGLERGPLRVLSRLLDFLGLIGLITLTLGWIGVYYLGRRWLTLEQPDVARLKFLGFTSARLQRMLLIKLGVVMSGGVILGGLLSWIIARAILPLFRESLPSELEVHWAWSNILTLISVGPVAGFALLFESVRACALSPPVIGGDQTTLGRVHPLGVVVLIALAAAIFVGLTLAQARSFVISGAFFGILAAALTLTAGSTWLGLLAVRRRHAKVKHWAWHVASAQWHRRPFTTILLVSVSALATLLAQLVPHLERTLVGSLDQPVGVTRPALFLFDIQDDQIAPLTELLAQNKLQISRSAPLIRARILKINDAPFERQRTGDTATREEETDASFRNRGVNLSYRAQLAAGEVITRGRAWTDMSPADISVEAKYAERVGLKLNDVVTFDIQGLEMTASVANLRRVDWNSFEPNFFIQFRDGVLSDAPKTWITTVAGTPALDVPAAQRLITKRFANVSMLDVRETIAAVSTLVQKLGRGLRVASRLTLGLGTFVILMVVYFQLVSSRADWRQLRWMGLSPRQIWGVQTLTFGGVVLVGTLLGAFLAGVGTLTLAHYAFATAPRLDWFNVWASTLTIWTLGLMSITLAGR